MKNRYTWLPLLIVVSTIIFNNDVNAQIITTVAGSGAASYTGDGGQATAAGLYQTNSVAFDNSGNLYISHTNEIRKVDASGIITRVTGSGVTAAYSGDGGPASAALVNKPIGMTFDPSGNFYFADNSNHCIRKITPGGVITTIAGNGTPGFAGDGFSATLAQLDNPEDVISDAAGNLYITDNHNHRVRKINTSGVISTIAGSGSTAYVGDGGPATAAGLYNPGFLAFDASGKLYISDLNHYSIRMINSSGVISTVAGTGTWGYSGDGGPATAATFYAPLGLAFDASGNLYVSDASSNRIRKIDVSGIITTIAGTGSTGYYGDGVPATSALLNLPSGLKVYGNSVFFADYQNYRVRKICLNPIVPPITGVTNVCPGNTIT
jgi:trimeric autotransporter adhesin